jgi:hypothetical protein
MENKIKALMAYYLNIWPDLTDDDFTQASENIGDNNEYTDSEWLGAYAIHIADVAAHNGYPLKRSNSR